MKKIKILYSGETTGAASGFGVYGHNILSRLIKNPKFHIAEFASFGSINDGKYSNAKWRYYPNAPEPGTQDFQIYESNPVNKFGAWRFERVLLDFQPDIVFTIRDPWMLMHEHRSPLRDFYHLAIMPTVDSAPQQHEWIEMFSTADAVFTYSDWAIPVLNEQSNGKINTLGSPYPGIETEYFYPSKNKQEDKAKFGLPTDSFIIGTVMRNQKRKLYEDLFKALQIYLEKYGNTEWGKKTYLLCHTSYPDFAGWKLDKLIKEYGIASRVYFTYLDEATNNIFIKKYAGTKAFSPDTNQLTLRFPNVGRGASREQLGQIYRCMDLYTQYAICFAKDQEVRTLRGWIPIQDVKIGDYCWTHKNRWRKVTNTFINLPHSIHEPMHEIKLYGDYETLQVTGNHKVFCYTSHEINHDKSRSVREKIGDKLRNNAIIPVFSKHEVKNLKSGDLLIYPIDDTIQDVNEQDLSRIIKPYDFISEYNIKIRNGDEYLRYINVDEKFCEFLGLYVADGSAGRNIVKVTCHKKEHYNINLANTIFNRISYPKQPKIRHYKDRKGLDVSIYSRLHCDWFLKHCGKHEHKSLPEWTEHLPLNKQKAILKGLFKGDGHFIPHKNISCYNTISKILADQIKNILRRLRISFNVRKITKTGNRKPQYKFEIFGDIQKGEFLSNRHITHNLYLNNYHLIQIKDIKTIPYNIDTYNIEVEGDNSLAVRACCASNCEGL